MLEQLLGKSTRCSTEEAIVTDGCGEGKETLRELWTVEKGGIEREEVHQV